MVELKAMTVILASDEPTLIQVVEEIFGSVTVDPTAATEGDILVLDARTHGTARDTEPLRRWRERASDVHSPVLALLSPRSASTDWLVAGADACLDWPSEPALLKAQVQALLRSVESQRRLAERAGRVRDLNRQLQELYRQSERDLELAYRLARQHTPKAITQVGRVRVGLCHRPQNRIGGDFYGIVRLDEDRIGIYLANAMGRGAMTSGLLSVLLRRRTVLKEIIGRSYRLIDPNEVLASLDAELRSLAMDELPLVSMVCSRIDCRDGHIDYSRAAGPPPLYVPRNQKPTFWEGESGAFLGSASGSYPHLSGQLRTGDRLLLMSDGVRPADNPDSVERLLDAASRDHSDIQEYVDSLASELLAGRTITDDFTLIGVECDE